MKYNILNNQKIIVPLENDSPLKELLLVGAE